MLKLDFILQRGKSEREKQRDEKKVDCSISDVIVQAILPWSDSLTPFIKQYFPIAPFLKSHISLPKEAR